MEHTKGEIDFSIYGNDEPATLYVNNEDDGEIDIADFERWGLNGENSRSNPRLCTRS